MTPKINSKWDITLENIIRYNGEKYYYSELEAFVNKHRKDSGIGSIEQHKCGCIMSATYIFPPFLNFIEHLDLMARIREANRDTKD